jgi:hypothetical protein
LLYIDPNPLRMGATFSERWLTLYGVTVMASMVNILPLV